MANITNSAPIEAIREKLGIQAARDALPTVSTNYIQPVISADPAFCDVFKSQSTTSSGAGSATIYSTPTDKDFYLTFLRLGYAKSANCDVANGTLSLNVVINGETISLMAFPIVNLTLQEQHMALYFDPPLKIDRNSTILQTGHTFTVGTFGRRSAVAGYLR